jgi:opacity protein-like surface antigen
MKKILLATAAAAVLSTSSAMAATGDFYGKANVGWSKLDDLKILKIKLKANNTTFIALGAGYYVMDNVRAELTLDHFFNVEHKSNDKDFSGKIKWNINSLMLNGYVDLFDAGVAKFFAGAGVGASIIGAKVTTLNKTTNKEATSKVKNTNYFTYALHLGASAELAEGVHGELTYSYRDLSTTGKNKTLDDKITLKGHHVAAGVRFDF